jgi:hypothetical protein
MWIVLKSRGFTPLFEKDDCREAGGTSPRKGEVDRVGNTRSRATQGAVADDCTDAGGRQCRSYIAEGRGRFFKQIPLDPPFSKGEVVFDEILSAIDTDTAIWISPRANPRIKHA